ncbi:hypothetical protein HPB47_020353 [Ixodes persulcatus]|uniref:Uncharacterized protein n=1 Tax=Ixodes persulcatus TaxID=34615 RepID=A0AC60QFR6_IXOPE|nr:hypothetical protein HPB47_020353 [Ixodes persulcatus]
MHATCNSLPGAGKGEEGEEGCGGSRNSFELGAAYTHWFRTYGGDCTSGSGGPDNRYSQRTAGGSKRIKNVFLEFAEKPANVVKTVIAMIVFLLLLVALVVALLILSGALPSARSILLCTFGAAGVVSAMMPDDGICDVIFYTHGFDRNDTFLGTGDEMAYGVFLEAARNFTQTTFGVSIRVRSARDRKTSDIVNGCQEAWNANVRHFGMLDVWELEDYDGAKDNEMITLLDFKGFHDTKRALYKGPLYIAFAASSTIDQAGTTKLMKRVLRDYNFLNLVVLKSHVSQWMNRSLLSGRGTQHQNHGFHSFTAPQRPEIQTADDMSKRKENTGVKFMIMYDDADLLANKTKLLLSNYLKPTSSGIAAFNVEYDDFSDVCARGSKPRPRPLRASEGPELQERGVAAKGFSFREEGLKDVYKEPNAVPKSRSESDGSSKGSPTKFSHFMPNSSEDDDEDARNSEDGGDASNQIDDGGGTPNQTNFCGGGDGVGEKRVEAAFAQRSACGGGVALRLRRRRAAARGPTT